MSALSIGERFDVVEDICTRQFVRLVDAFLDALFL